MMGLAVSSVGVYQQRTGFGINMCGNTGEELKAAGN
jgi:hypothetical protein